MAGAVPGVGGGVIFKGTAQVGTAGESGSKEIYCASGGVGDEGRELHGPGGSKYPLKFVFLACYLRCEELCGHHGRGHAPGVEASGDVNIGRGGGVAANVGDAVKCYAVLIYPAADLAGVGDMLF